VFLLLNADCNAFAASGRIGTRSPAVAPRIGFQLALRSF